MWFFFRNRRRVRRDADNLMSWCGHRGWQVARDLADHARRDGDVSEAKRYAKVADIIADRYGIQWQADVPTRYLTAWDAPILPKKFDPKKAG